MEKKYLRDNELLSKEYYHEKNVDIDFDALTLGSNKHVWWICSSCGWSWNTTVGNRGISKRGCPECAKKKISKTLERNAAKRNNFAEKYPHLVKEWHPVNNGDKTPNDVSCSSEYFAWWKCHICGCEWKAKVVKRTNRGFGCPNCAKQSTSFDEQAIFFYVKKLHDHTPLTKTVSFTCLLSRCEAAEEISFPVCHAVCHLGSRLRTTGRLRLRLFAWSSGRRC